MKKSEKHTISEEISVCRSSISYYQNLLDGGYKKRRLPLEKKLQQVQEQIQELDCQFAEAEHRIEKFRIRIGKAENILKQKQFKPEIDRIRKIAAQLSEMKEGVKEMNISEEDLNLLKMILGEETIGE